MANYAGSQNNLHFVDFTLCSVIAESRKNGETVFYGQILGENRLCFWQAEAARTQSTCSTVLHWIIYLTQLENITPAYSITCCVPPPPPPTLFLSLFLCVILMKSRHILLNTLISCCFCRGDTQKHSVSMVDIVTVCVDKFKACWILHVHLM